MRRCRHDANGNVLGSGPHIYPEFAAAGLWTTATDLALFALALRDAWREKPRSLLSPFITQQMFLPGLAQYGLGLIVVGKRAASTLLSRRRERGLSNA